MIRHKKSERDEVMGETRTRLLEAAAEEFAQKGYEGANVNHIARAAGYSIGTVYNYFPSKRELMAAFIEDFSQVHVNQIKERVLQEQQPDKRVEIFFASGFSFVETHLTQSRAIFNTLNGPDDEFKFSLFQYYLPLFELLRVDIIELGIQQGVFRQVEAQTIANLLMMLYLGVASQVNPQGKPWIDALQVSGFVLSALRAQREPGKEGNL
ncbi:MAG TPA: TetR/AcrR family transcriptional regulator [Anaerolineales bacterium]|nr:TetR/AcrR family transcriptional regulator [Anaerolineales bacterium]